MLFLCKVGNSKCSSFSGYSLFYCHFSFLAESLNVKPTKVIKTRIRGLSGTLSNIDDGSLL